MPQVVSIWTNLFYGITERAPLKPGYKIINSFKIGEKTVGAQLLSNKMLKNGNIQKRITTVFPNGSLGLETRVLSPNGELLKAYTGVRTTSGTKPIPLEVPQNISDNQIQIEAAKKMYQMQHYYKPNTLDDVLNGKKFW